MGILEWLGAHLLSPAINLWRAIQTRPRPDVRIIELAPTGGGTYVDFSVLIQNYGTQPIRVTVTGRVGENDVQVTRPTLDLLVNAPPERVSIHVPRPDLGNLVDEFDDETTLYDQTLVVEAKGGKHRAQEEWHEVVYDPETNRERQEIQQRVWRRGRGEETRRTCAPNI